MTRETFKEAVALIRELEDIESMLKDFHHISSFNVISRRTYGQDGSRNYDVSESVSESIRRILLGRIEELEKQLEKL